MTLDLGKRSIVIRSPLELLAEDRTPPPKLRDSEKEGTPPHPHPHPQHDAGEPRNRYRSRTQGELPSVNSSSSSPTRETRGSSSGTIRVTRTTSNNVISVPFGAPPLATTRPTQRHDPLGSAAADSRRGAHPHEIVEVTSSGGYSHLDPPASAATAVSDDSSVVPAEPSTLLYLSPSYRSGGGVAAGDDGSGDKSRGSGGGGKGKRKVASAVPTTAAAAPSQRSVAVSPHGRRLADDPAQMTPSDALIPLSDVDDLIREALEAYEARRDEEEAAILLEIRNESDAMQNRCAELELANRTLQSEKDSLSALVERLETQCAALADTTKLIHSDLLNERRRCGELEVRVCHADDARRTAVAETARDRDFEHAQFLAMKSEYDSQMDGLRRAHSDELARKEFCLHEQDAKLTELTASLAASESENATLRAKLKEMESGLEAIRQQLREKESALHHLTRKSSALEKAEGGRRDEVSILAEKVQKQDETIRQQNDDLRKKLSRIQAIEAELAKQQQAVADVHAGAQKVEERSQLVHASAEALAAALREGLRRAPTAVKPSENQHRRRAVDAAAKEDKVVDDSDEGSIASMDDEIDNDEDDDDDAAFAGARAAALSEYTRGNFVLPARHPAPLALRGLKPSLSLPLGRRATHQPSKSTRSHSVPQKSSRSDASADGDPSDHHNSRRQGSATASMGSTLRLLTVARERAHVLLRRLHLREAEEHASVQTLKESLAAEEKRANEGAQKIDGLRQQVDALSVAHQKAQRRIATLEENCSTQSEELRKRVAELSELRAAASVDSDRVTSLTFAVHEARIDAETKATALQAAEAKANSASAEVTRLLTELTAAQQAREMALRDLAGKDKLVHENDALLLQQARELADVSVSRERLQKQVTKLHSELAHTRAEWTRVQEEANLAHAKLQKSEAALAALRKRHRVDDQRSAVTADLEKRIDGLAREIVERDTKLAKLKGEVDEARADRARIAEEERSAAERILRQHMDNAAQAREVASAQAMQTIRALESHVTVFSKSLFSEKGGGREEAWDTLPFPKLTRSASAAAVPREVVSHANGGALLPNLSYETDVCAALVSLEANLCDVLNRAQLAHAQQRRQVHSLQQTVSFLELEVQCQRSNARSTGGTSASRGSRGGVEHSARGASGVVDVATTGALQSLEDSGVVRVIAATPTRRSYASFASSSVATVAAASSPPPPQRLLAHYRSNDLSPQVVDCCPVVAAPPLPPPSSSSGPFMGSVPPTYILVTTSPVASGDLMPPSQPKRSETPPRSGRTPSPPAVRPTIGHHHDDAYESGFGGDLSQQPSASWSGSYGGKGPTCTTGAARQMSASDEPVRKLSIAGAAGGEKECAATKTTAAVLGSSSSAASCSTSRSVDGLSASPLRPPRMGGRARSLVA